jgi:uncharacterized protein YndB with AHSA1/START domain
VQIDRSAPVVASAEIEISASPEVVWDTLADFESWPRWQRDVKSLSIEGPVEKGTEFKWKAGPTRLASTIEVVERPHRIGWTGKGFGVYGVHLWSFEARDGRTLARTEESWAGLVPRLFRGRMQNTLQAALDDGLAQLKAEAERRAAS